MAKFEANGLPLYLKLAFEEAQRWKSWAAQTSPPVALSPDIPGILLDLFERLEQPQHHGRLLVSRALGYLTAARIGLTEDELLDVLSADGDVMQDFRRRSPRSPAVGRLPVVVWSRLFFDLEPFLTTREADGTTVMAFYHPTSFGQSVKAHYLGAEAK
jgi:hypothetical protein